MKVSNIDQNFIEIVDYLNAHGYKPWASCDGVLSSHKHPDEVTYAYIAFLKTKKVFPLMAAFLRDSDFMVSMGNCSHNKPYELYGNRISGNSFSVHFYNRNNEKTAYFERIIKGVTEHQISISNEEIQMVQRFSDALRNPLFKKTGLFLMINFHSDDMGGLGTGINIDIKHRTTRKIMEKERDLTVLADRLFEKFDSTEDPISYIKNQYPAYPNDREILLMDGGDIRIHVNKGDEAILLDMIRYAMKIEKTCPMVPKKPEAPYEDDNYDRYYDDDYDELSEVGSEYESMAQQEVVPELPSVSFKPMDSLGNEEIEVQNTRSKVTRRPLTVTESLLEKPSNGGQPNNKIQDNVEFE